MVRGTLPPSGAPSAGNTVPSCRLPRLGWEGFGAGLAGAEDTVARGASPGIGRFRAWSASSTRGEDGPLRR
jgi:hypothetical protein